MKRLTGIVIVLALVVPVVLAGDITTRNRKLVDRSGMAMHTIGEMRTVQIVLEAYKIDHKEYPVAASMEELRKLAEPIYVRTLPLRDAWGNELRYVRGADGQSYQLISAGSDRTFAPETWKSPGLLQSSKDDCVFNADDALDREWIIQR